MSTNNFITDFRASSLVERICNNYDVIMIWLSGSSVIGLTDHLSDYDLGVLVADQVIFSKTEKTGESYVYKEDRKEVHCIYNSFDDVAARLHEGALAPYRYLGWAQFRCINEDHIIYINPKYTEVVEQLVKYKESLAENSIRTFLSLLTPQLQLAKTIEHVKVIKWGKLLSHLCWCVEELQKVPHNYEQLLILKRAFPRQLSPQNLTADVLAYAFEKIQYAKEYLEAHPDSNPEIDEIIADMLKLIEKND